MTQSGCSLFPVILGFKTLILCLWQKNGGVVVALNERANSA